MSDPSGVRGRRLLGGLLLAAALLVIGGRLFPGIALALTPHDRAPLPDPSDEPLQGETSVAPFSEWRRMTEFRLTPRASFDISARVLSTERYWSGPSGGILPWDFALGWGAASHDEVLRRLSISQYARFYVWSTDDPTIDRSAIASSSSNVHLVPGTSRIEGVLGRVRAGDLVRLVGELVDVSGPDGFLWQTSLTRGDTGPGACETLYVRSITVGDRLYR